MKKQLVLLMFLLTMSTGSFASQQKVKVFDVQPVYEYVVVEKPVEYCRPIRPQYTATQHDRILLGSVVGGTIGSLTSERHNKTKATIIGAVIGGVIGSQIDNAGRYSTQSQTMQCSTRYVSSEKIRVIKGYEYWYRIKGKMYQGFSLTAPNRYVSLH
jgi:uncharacterized protein YcfJ